MSAVVAGMAVVTAAALAYAGRCRYAARHDQLTGLRNRAGLSTVYRRIGRQPLAVLLLDLDGFKPVNDTHGHAAGDEVLSAVGRRLSCVTGATVARLGGDEFVLITRAGWRLTIARQAAAAVAMPIVLSGGPVIRVTASIGVSTRPESLRRGLAEADAAMYRAKSDAVRIALYDPHRDDRSEEDRPAVRLRDTRMTAGTSCPVCGWAIAGGTCTNPTCWNRAHEGHQEGLRSL